MQRSLLDSAARWLADAVRLAQSRQEPPTTAHLLAIIVGTDDFERIGERLWKVSQVRSDAIRLLSDPTDCHPLQRLLIRLDAGASSQPVSASEVFQALWNGWDAPRVLLRRAGVPNEFIGWSDRQAERPPASPADLAVLTGWVDLSEDRLERLIQAGEMAGEAAAGVMRTLAQDPHVLARALWRGFSEGRLRPASPAYWKLMAADSSAYDEAAVKSLFAFLHAEWKDFAHPGRSGEPPGWRNDLGLLLIGLPSTTGLAAWAQTLPQLWRTGLTEGLRRVEQHRKGPVALIEGSEPKWTQLARLIDAQVWSENCVANALAAAGWYAGDCRGGVRGRAWFPAGLRAAALPSEGRPDPAPIAEVPEHLHDRVAKLEDRTRGARRVGPPDYVAVAQLASGWRFRLDHTSDFELTLDDLRASGDVGILNEDPFGTRIEAHHRGGRTTIWLIGEGDGEHAPAPHLLARDMYTFLDLLPDCLWNAWQPTPQDAVALDPCGDQGLATWLASLPRFTQVVDLRSGPIPAQVPLGALWRPDGMHGVGLRCGEVVVKFLPTPIEELLLTKVLDPNGAGKAMGGLGLHPRALRRRLDRLREVVGPALAKRI